MIEQPGIYGWPYCIRENVPYNDYDYTTDAGAGTASFNCARPVNDSPNNTGLTNLPPAHPAPRCGRATPRPTPGSRTSAPAAPRWAARATTSTRATPPTTKFPAFFDGQWFIGEWNNDWIQTPT